MSPCCEPGETLCGVSKAILGKSAGLLQQGLTRSSLTGPGRAATSLEERVFLLQNHLGSKARIQGLATLWNQGHIIP